MEFFNNPQNAVLYIVLSIWSIIWKGIALWRSAKFDQKNWFIAILLINIIGLLEIIYLFKFAKKRLTIDEVKGWFGK